MGLFRTDDILYGVGDWASTMQPDVVLLCIGGNHFEQGLSASRALTNTCEIINTLRAVNPDVVVLWGFYRRIRTAAHR